MRRDQRGIRKQQDALLEAMAEIRKTRRGTVSEQRYKERAGRKGGSGSTGPYYVWQGTVDGERFSERISAEDAERMEREIAGRRRFEAFCKEYVALGEALADSEAEEGKSEEALKKGLKPRSRRVKKSRG